MANTTNFGWETPDDTDLVKDGAAAMRTLGNAIDTSFVDFKGGTTGQILAKNSNTDLDFVWSAAPTAPSINWTQVANSATTSGSTVTISSITNADKLLVLLKNVSTTVASKNVWIEINSDTGSNYKLYRYSIYNASAYAANSFVSDGASQSNISMGALTSNAASQINGSLFIFGGNTAGKKSLSFISGPTAGGGNGGMAYLGGGIWDNSATISSISVVTDGVFDNGSIEVFKSE